MNKGKVFGISLTLTGLLLVLLSNSILTGAVIGIVKSSVINMIGALVFLAGLIIAIFSSRYEEAESKLIAYLGEKKYEHLPPEEKSAYLKSIMRHEGKREQYAGRAEHPRIIRTVQFEKAIRNHNKTSIERAIKKIGTGKGKEIYKPLLGHRSIRESRGGRLLFDKKGGEYVLVDYVPQSEHD